MALVIGPHYYPNPIAPGATWEPQVYQYWWRGVDAEDDTGFNIDANYVPYINGAHVSLFVVPVSGDLSDLDMDMQVAQEDLQNAPGVPLLEAIYGGGTGVVATNIFSRVYVHSLAAANFTFNMDATLIRPEITAVAGQTAIVDFCVQQTAVAFNGRGPR